MRRRENLSKARLVLVAVQIRINLCTDRKSSYWDVDEKVVVTKKRKVFQRQHLTNSPIHKTNPQMFLLNANYFPSQKVLTSLTSFHHKVIAEEFKKHGS